MVQPLNQLQRKKNAQQFIPRSSKFCYLLVFAASFIFIFLVMDRNISLYDEGIILTGAMRVEAGEIIHRDFYANYGPGQFYVLAHLYKWFGMSVATERAWDLFIRAGIVTLVYVGMRQFTQNWAAPFFATACLLWLSVIGNHGYPIYPALFLSLSGTLLVVRCLAQNDIRFGMLAAGSLTAASALFRYDIGFFAGTANIATILMACWLIRKRSPGPTHGLTTNLTLYVTGAGIPILLLLVFYQLNSAMNGFTHDVLLFPAEHYARTRSLPFPSLLGSGFITGISQLSIYLPLLLCAWTLFVVWRRKNSSKIPPHPAIDMAKPFSCALAILGVSFYAKGVVRVSIEHTQLSLIPAVMALSGCFTLTRQRDDRMTRWLSTALAISAMLAALCTAYLYVRTPTRVIWSKSWITGYLKNSGETTIDREIRPIEKTATSPFFLLDKDREAAVDYLSRSTSTEERIYAGTSRHDKIFINDVAAYFLADRLPITHWHHFDPELQNSTQVQTHIIQELEKARTRYIWLESTWNNIAEPNTSSLSSGVILLDQYIARHYVPDRTFGSITILLRNGSR